MHDLTFRAKDDASPIWGMRLLSSVYNLATDSHTLPDRAKTDMYHKHNLVSRQWAVTINVSAISGPRDLTGYRALCIDLQPQHFTCFVEIDRPKTSGVVNVTFIDDTISNQMDDQEKIYCELGLQDNSGKIEKLAAFSLEIE